MKNKTQKAFIIADGITAMLVVAVGVNLLFICEQQLSYQRQNSQLKLAAIRLGKEASDLYALKGKTSILTRTKMVARADAQGVTVYYQGKCIWRIK